MMKILKQLWKREITEEIIAKIASEEFVKSFHETLVSYGNEMIADRIYEVFGK